MKGEQIVEKKAHYTEKAIQTIAQRTGASVSWKLI